MSKYDAIETAADLIREVAAHGLSLKQEDINRAADIFGNSTIGELHALANDIGRNSERGEPNPNGTWSSGRKGTQDTFYFILFNIWNWRQATEFFNKHTNPITMAAAEISKELAEETKRKEGAFAERDHFKQSASDCHAMYTEEYRNRVAAEAALAATQTEVLTLKAKLYDLMTVGA